MKVLITGATGLVGQAIVEELWQLGYSVNYLTTSKKKLVSKENYRGYLWNPSKGEIDLKSFDGVTAIINLAGASIAKRWTPKQKKIILNSRVDSLRTLKTGLSKIDRKNIKSVISASAVGVYPDSKSTYYDENFKGVDDSFLGEVVEAWEQEVDKLNIFDLKIAKIRIGLVLSNKGGALPQMAKPIKNYVGAAIGSGEQWQSWIHLEDLARLFVFTLENNLEGVYNGVAPNPVTNSKLTRELADVLKKPLFLPNVPAFALRLILGDMAYILLASQRVCSKKIQEEGFDFLHSNVNGALNEIYDTASEAPIIADFGKKEYI